LWYNLNGLRVEGVLVSTIGKSAYLKRAAEYRAEPDSRRRGRQRQGKTRLCQGKGGASEVRGSNNKRSNAPESVKEGTLLLSEEKKG